MWNEKNNRDSNILQGSRILQKSSKKATGDNAIFLVHVHVYQNATTKYMYTWQIYEYELAVINYRSWNRKKRKWNLK